eukprot:6213371-Pleurochrysis_carterae.AAC.1
MSPPMQRRFRSCRMYVIAQRKRGIIMKRESRAYASVVGWLDAPLYEIGMGAVAWGGAGAHLLRPSPEAWGGCVSSAEPRRCALFSLEDGTSGGWN